MQPQHYAIATIEGLHLTCDFVVYSAALFGCPPDYSSTRVGLHDSYRKPYETLTSIPLSEYPQFQENSFMDELTMQAVRSATVPRMRDFSCIAWELPEEMGASFTTDPASNSAVLSRVIGAGEQILDIMRLFPFKPGEDVSIGRVGSLGGGYHGPVARRRGRLTLPVHRSKNVPVPVGSRTATTRAQRPPPHLQR